MKVLETCVFTLFDMTNSFHQMMLNCCAEGHKIAERLAECGSSVQPAADLLMLISASRWNESNGMCAELLS